MYFHQTQQKLLLFLASKNFTEKDTIMLMVALWYKVALFKYLFLYPGVSLQLLKGLPLAESAYLSTHKADAPAVFGIWNLKFK